MSRCQKQLDAILLSITNSSIWAHRNQIVHKEISFNPDYFNKKKIASIIIISRYGIKKYQKTKTKKKQYRLYKHYTQLIVI